MRWYSACCSLVHSVMGVRKSRLINFVVAALDTLQKPFGIGGLGDETGGISVAGREGFVPLGLESGVVSFGFASDEDLTRGHAVFVSVLAGDAFPSRGGGPGLMRHVIPL